MNSYDIIVIGAGPAGLMAAGCASENGARVLVLEKNSQAGIKLLMTGGGRCNFTNTLPNNIFAKAFGQNGSWLLSGLSRFDSSDIVNFFASRNILSVANQEGKVFPNNNSASKIRDVLVEYVESNGGKIIYNANVIKIVKNNDLISKIVLLDRSELSADKYIIAVGGNSYPLSGSSGDAYNWLKDLGHKVVKARAALAPIVVKESFIKELEGLSFSGVCLELSDSAKKIVSESGDIIFTSEGLSGPAALNLSRAICRENIEGLTIKLDLFPDEKIDALDKQLQELLSLNHLESIKNILSKLVVRRMAKYILESNKIDSAKKSALISKPERELIISSLKNIRLSFVALGGFNEAMITSGGVDLKEVDQKTMASKLYPNLYFAGEILDLDGPTGGYNLQLAWTSGYIAGESASLK